MRDLRITLAGYYNGKMVSETHKFYATIDGIVVLDRLLMMVDGAVLLSLPFGVTDTEEDEDE